MLSYDVRALQAARGWTDETVLTLILDRVSGEAEEAIRLILQDVVDFEDDQEGAE